MELINFENNQLTISSREVAEMMNMRHSDFLRKIEAFNKVFTERKIALSKFWIKSEYTDLTGRTLKEYQITKKGCEFLAHKSTGEKGTLFTVAYMDRFEQMEQALKNKQQSIVPCITDDLNKLVSNLHQTLEDCKSYYKINCATKYQYSEYIKKRLGILKVNKEYEQVKARLFTILGVQKWEDISHYDKSTIVSLIDESIKVIKSERKYERTIMDI